MLYTPPKSCPICENTSIISSNHKCQDYYDDMYKSSLVTTTNVIGAIMSDGFSTFDKKKSAATDDLWKQTFEIGASPVIRHTQEPSMLIPLSLIMDLYAMAVIADNEEVLEGLKKAIKGEK